MSQQAQASEPWSLHAVVTNLSTHSQGCSRACLGMCLTLLAYIFSVLVQTGLPNIQTSETFYLTHSGMTCLQLFQWWISVSRGNNHMSFERKGTHFEYWIMFDSVGMSSVLTVIFMEFQKANQQGCTALHEREHSFSLFFLSCDWKCRQMVCLQHHFLVQFRFTAFLYLNWDGKRLYTLKSILKKAVKMIQF